MTRRELETALGGLLEAFPNAFNPARMERIQAILSGVSIGDIRRLSTHILDHARYAPLPEDFKRGIAELGIKREVVAEPGRSAKKRRINIAYIEGDWFFDDEYVFNRASRASVIRSMTPDHPMVIKAADKERLCFEGKAKFIPAVGSGFPEPDKSVYEFFYPETRKPEGFKALKLEVPSAAK